jgi:transcriptional regulator with XRE-family HTH domain
MNAIEGKELYRFFIMELTYDIGERLKKIMYEKKITISKLADLSELSEDTIKSIRSGKTKNPSISVIIALADALNCSIDGFLDRKFLQTEEVELLKDYRALNRHGKNALNMLLESEKHLQSDKGMDNRQLACIVPTQVKDSDVDFSMHKTEYINVPSDYFPEADFAVKIISYTLYPVFSRGDVLAVQKKFPPVGTMGLFLDSQGTEMIRRYTEKDNSIYLESISNCNKSFFYTDDIICLGTILGIIRTTECQRQELI